MADDPPLPAPHWVSVQVRVVPPVDPAGKSWKVQLLERREGKDEIVSDEPAPENRSLELRVAEKRFYSLRLRTGDGDIWFTDPDPFEAKGEMPVRVIEPKALKVRGLVTLGKRPLAKAQLAFGNEAGPESISLTSKEDGTFVGFLPRFGRWHVTSRSESPHLHREVDVDVIHSDRGAELDVEVRLIPRGVEGELVDVDGHRIMKGMVNQFGPSGDHADERVERGTFRFERLNDGANSFEASAGYRDEDGKLHSLRSETTDVTVEAGTADPAWLQIVLRREVGLKGRVVSPAGSGVPRATVLFIETKGGAHTWFVPKRSGADGRFTLPLREGTSEACVAVIQGSFSARLTRVQVTGDEQELSLSPLGGTLLVDAPFWNSKRLEDKRVVVFHAGCAIYPAVLQNLVKGSHGDTGVRWTYRMQRVEHGPYSVCAVTNSELAAYDGRAAAFEPCVYGVLAPGGMLELKLLP
ncbi:MAG: carboxypeptidase-like regulatory domain-containing protein [Acidobacteriota bacterium]|nr:carboxypeptidase-like regulatory domain-containing protein [Acidobacteriota bacterium]